MYLLYGVSLGLVRKRMVAVALAATVVWVGLAPFPAAAAETDEVLLSSTFIAVEGADPRGSAAGRVTKGGRVALPTSGDPGCDTWDDCWDIRDTRRDGVNRPFISEVRGDNKDGTGPLTITLSRTYTSRDSFSAGITFGKKDLVSVAFGIQIDRSVSDTYHASYEVPARSCARIEMRARYQDYKGDIWWHPAFRAWRYMSWVRAWEFRGIEFYVYSYQCP